MFLQKYLAAADDKESLDIPSSDSDLGDKNTSGEEANEASAASSVEDTDESLLRKFSVKDIEQVYSNTKHDKQYIFAPASTSNTAPNTHKIENRSTDNKTAGATADTQKRDCFHKTGSMVIYENVSPSQLHPSLTKKINQTKNKPSLATTLLDTQRDQALKKSFSCSDLSASIYFSTNFMISQRHEIASQKTFKTCYVQTDESCFSSEGIWRIDGNSVKGKDAITGVTITPQDESSAYGISSNNQIRPKVEQNIDVTKEIKSTDDTKVEDQSKIANEKEEVDDEYEIEYSFVDEDGNELPLDKEILAESLELLEDSGDEIDVIFDEESDDEMILYLNEDGEYVDEEGNLILTIDSDDDDIDDDDIV